MITLLQGADIMLRFDFYLGPSVDSFADMLIFLGAKKVTKAISGNTTHVVRLYLLDAGMRCL